MDAQLESGFLIPAKHQGRGDVAALYKPIVGVSRREGREQPRLQDVGTGAINWPHAHFRLEIRHQPEE